MFIQYRVRLVLIYMRVPLFKIRFWRKPVSQLLCAWSMIKWLLN